MLLKKLKQIRTKIFKKKDYLRERKNLSKTNNPQEMPNENIDTSSMVGIKYLQRRLLASNKQYFDSADYFLKIYEIEKDPLETQKEAIAQEIPKPSVIETASSSSFNPSSNDCASVPPAPLETAYSEIIDEMKPKEHV
ncbi:hypothetical protein NEOKW01_1085 [Nematocida sp. AWRm80]|nr:hypothetical protein NEOKW01_1085 [Nematocida sp. AWRm80]